MTDTRDAYLPDCATCRTRGSVCDDLTCQEDLAAALGVPVSMVRPVSFDDDPEPVTWEDELQPYISEQMQDPAFAYAYGRAEGFAEALALPLWRRITRRAWMTASADEASSGGAA